jgi:hypothetical protein
LMALACFFSHIAAFGVYALAICGVEMPQLLAELRARRWPALARRGAVAAIQFIVPAVLFLAWRRQAAEGAFSYAGFARKADLLFSVFDNYDRTFDIACFALFLALGVGLAASGRLGLMPRLGWAAGLVGVAYLLLPSQLYGGSGADHRLPLALFLLIVAGSAPRFPSRHMAIAIGTAAVLLLSLRIAVIERVWRRADRVYAADLAGIDALPIHARLAVAYPPDAVHVVPVPLVHLAALATARRDAFVPTLFAIAGQQPLAQRPPWTELAEAARPQLLWAALVSGDRAAGQGLPPILANYDFIVFAGRKPVAGKPDRCLRAVFEQPDFQIFAILATPGCVGARR